MTAVEQDQPVTLRGVFYRVVSARAVEKSENGYRAVGRRLLTLRREGRIPYSAITDGTRWISRPTTHNDLDAMLHDAAASYRRALWRDQPVEVHLFTEKDAISGVVLPITSRWDVPLGVLRGYCSETFAYNVAQAIIAAGKPTFVYQLGDHDPSGLDAWRDFQDKVSGFLGGRSHVVYNELGHSHLAEVTFDRLAVTESQITDLGLPTRPTKRSDTRAAAFRGGSVEVDAIPAPTLRILVEDAITQHIEPRAWQLTSMVEQQERDLLAQLAGWK